MDDGRDINPTPPDPHYAPIQALSFWHSRSGGGLKLWSGDFHGFTADFYAWLWLCSPSADAELGYAANPSENAPS
jgi:hypothetical protein